MMEAARRVRERQPVISHVHPTKPGAVFKMSLSRGELILAKVKRKGDKETRDMLLVFRTAASTSGQMWFTLHTDARQSTDVESFSFKASTLKGKKVTVDPLGRVKWAERELGEQKQPIDPIVAEIARKYVSHTVSLRKAKQMVLAAGIKSKGAQFTYEIKRLRRLNRQ